MRTAANLRQPNVDARQVIWQKLPMTSWFARFILCLGLLVGCGHAPDLIGVDNPTAPVRNETQASTQKVFIMTTREASDVSAVFYGPERAPELGFASVVVSVPPIHVPGELERPRRLPPDPAKEFAVIEPTVYADDTVFVGHINRALAERAPEDRIVLFYVHGYNTSISDAVLRLGQFVEDTEFNGVPVLFSWASASQVTRYVYDLNSALIARPKFLEATRVLRRTNANSFDVFAHSMGTFLTMEAITQGVQSGQFGQATRPNTLMLASPDIDLDLFRSQVSYLPAARSSIFVMVSEDDAALRVSQRLSGGVTRLGNTPAKDLTDLGVTVIDLSEVDDSQAGSHSKYAGSPEIVQLIGEGLSQNKYQTGSRGPSFVEVLEGVPILRVLTP